MAGELWRSHDRSAYACRISDLGCYNTPPPSLSLTPAPDTQWSYADLREAIWLNPMSQWIKAPLLMEPTPMSATAGSGGWFECLISLWTLCTTPRCFPPYAHQPTMSQVHPSITWTSNFHTMLSHEILAFHICVCARASIERWATPTQTQEESL